MIRVYSNTMVKVQLYFVTYAWGLNKKISSQQPLKRATYLLTTEMFLKTFSYRILYVATISYSYIYSYLASYILIIKSVTIISRYVLIVVCVNFYSQSQQLICTTIKTLKYLSVTLSLNKLILKTSGRACFQILLDFMLMIVIQQYQIAIYMQ